MIEENTVELVEILFKISRRMKQEMSYTNDLIHLSVLQIQTLILLSQNIKISMSDIADHFRMELSSATSLLNKLYDMKLVERNTDQDDRRLVLITLTNEGKTLLKQAVCERRKKIEKFLSYLSKNEKTDLLDILKMLDIRLNKKYEK